MTCAPKRRWFRCSLRTMLMAFAVLSSVVAYIVGQYTWRQRRQEFLRNPKNCTVAQVRPDVYAPGLWVFRDFYYEKISLATHSKLPPARENALALAKRLFPEAEIGSKLLRGRDGEIEDVYRANSWEIPLRPCHSVDRTPRTH